MPIMQTRRRFMTTLSLAGAAGLLGAPPTAAAEGPPERTSVRFMRTPSLCHAPQFVAEELLRAEGFTEIQYIEGEVQRRDQPGYRKRQGGFQYTLCPAMGIRHRWRRTGHRFERRACRLL